MRFKKSITIEASKGRVWDTLTDFKSYPLWMGSNEKVEFTSSETQGKGTSFIVLGMMSGVVYKTYNRVVDWKEDEKLVMEIESMYGKGFSQYELNKIPGGCEVVYYLDLTIFKKFQQNPDLIHKNLATSMEEALYRLKKYLEATPN